MMKVAAIFASVLVASVAADGKVGRLRTNNGRDLARGGQAPTAKASKNAKSAEKAKICHYDDEDLACPYKNIEVSVWALRTHLNKHGDTEGTCQDYCIISGVNYDPETCTCETEDESMSLSTPMNIEFGRIFE